MNDAALSDLTEITRDTYDVCISAMMYSSETALRVIQSLSLEDFNTEAHKAIFRAVSMMLSEGEQVNFAEVNVRLMEMGALEVVGGNTVVFQLGQRFDPHNQAIDNIIDRVRDFSMRRRLSQVAGNIGSGIFDLTRDATEIYGEATNDLLSVIVGREEALGISTIDPDSMLGELTDAQSNTLYSTGFDALDDLYMIDKTEMCIVTGRPGSGKSLWTLQVAGNLAASQDWRWIVWSPEHSKAETVRRIITPLLGFRPAPTNSEDSKAKVRRALVWCREHFRFIDTSTAGATLEGILGLAITHAHTWPFDGLILDPWTELSSERPAYMSETEHVKDQLTRVRAFGKKYEKAVYIVAHPTKGLEKDEVPTLKSISGSAHFWNKADVGVTVHRPALDNPGGENASNKDEVEVYITKVRNDEVGTVGVRSFHWDSYTMKFNSTPSEQNMPI